MLITWYSYDEKYMYNINFPVMHLYMYTYIEHWNTDYLWALFVEFLHEESLSIQKLTDKGLPTGDIPILIGQN